MKDGTENLELEELAEEPAVEEVEGETPEAAEEEPEGVVITLAGEEPPEQKPHVPAPQWVKDLRKREKELTRRLRELEAEKAAIAAPEKSIELPPKPNIEDKQFDFNVEKYTEALEAWFEKKRAHDERVRKAQESQQAAQKEWQDRLAKYGEAKAALPVPDYDEAEDVVRGVLSVTQQGILLQGAERPEALVYALGTRPNKAKELAAITDPVKFAFAVARLEANMTISGKAKPAPERTVKGAGALSGTVDSTLEKLRAEADRTGDRTKVAAYIRARKQKD